MAGTQAGIDTKKLQSNELGRGDRRSSSYVERGRHWPYFRDTHEPKKNVWDLDAFLCTRKKELQKVDDGLVAGSTSCPTRLFCELSKALIFPPSPPTYFTSLTATTCISHEVAGRRRFSCSPFPSAPSDDQGVEDQCNCVAWHCALEAANSSGMANVAPTPLTLFFVQLIMRTTRHTAITHKSRSLLVLREARALQDDLHRQRRRRRR